MLRCEVTFGLVFLFPPEQYILLHPRSLALSFPLLLLFELCLYLPNRLLLSSLAFTTITIAITITITLAPCVTYTAVYLR